MSNSDSKITIVQQFYYQIHGRNPNQVTSKFDRQLKTKEQFYTRWKIVGEEAQELDTGWIDDPEMIIIQNVEGKDLNRIPTEEEREKIANRILQVCIKSPHQLAYLPILKVRPGEDVTFTPVQGQAYYLRCQKETASSIIHAI